MYKKQKATKSTLPKINKSTQGETIEEKIQRIVNNKEPITDGAPLIYQERKNGVDPACDIRTDRFEIAVEAMDVVSKSMIAKREGTAATGISQGEKSDTKSTGTTTEGTVNPGTGANT